MNSSSDPFFSKWFGNLVTMEWWNDLWLNEGFAIFMEFLAIDSIYPEWRVFQNFIQQWYIPAMELDAFKVSTRKKPQWQQLSEF